MPGTDAWQFLGAALGASPTPLAFSEVYTALSTGAVDGQDNPLPTVVDKKFYEVTKQIALTAHLVDLNYIAFSKETWDGLTSEQKMTVQRAADAAAAYGRLKQLDKENNLADFIRSQGVEIYTPDLKAFRDHVQAQYVGSEAAASWPDGVLDRIYYHSFGSKPPTSSRNCFSENESCYNHVLSKMSRRLGKGSFLKGHGYAICDLFPLRLLPPLPYRVGDKVPLQSSLWRCAPQSTRHMPAGLR